MLIVPANYRVVHLIIFVLSNFLLKDMKSASSSLCIQLMYVFICYSNIRQLNLRYELSYFKLKLLLLLILDSAYIVFNCDLFVVRSARQIQSKQICGSALWNHLLECLQLMSKRKSLVGFWGEGEKQYNCSRFRLQDKHLSSSFCCLSVFTTFENYYQETLSDSLLHLTITRCEHLSHLWTYSALLWMNDVFKLQLNLWHKLDTFFLSAVHL